MAGIVALVTALGLAFVVKNERALQRHKSARSNPLPRANPRLSAKTILRHSWSPYAAGAALGLLVTATMAGFGHRLSGAGAAQNLSGYVGRLLAPQSMVWQHVIPTGMTWDVLVTLGALIGAFVSARFAGDFALRAMPDRQWTDVFGRSVPLRWILAFIGSMLTEIGAGLAGGCTASLAVSGGAVLAPAAFAFMAGMFTGGIPTAFFIYRKRRGRA